jgi:hypothetical protein
MLPRDTITITNSFLSEGTFTIIPYNGKTFTIIGWQMSTDGGTLATEKIKNADKTIGYNWSADKGVNSSPYVEVNIVSNSQIQIIKTSDNKATELLINYVPRDRTLIPDPVYEYQNASTTNGFSQGDILTNYFLFIIMVALVFGFILKFFKGKR